MSKPAKWTYRPRTSLAPAQSALTPATCAALATDLETLAAQIGNTVTALRLMGAADGYVSAATSADARQSLLAIADSLENAPPGIHWRLLCYSGVHRAEASATDVFPGFACRACYHEGGGR